VEYIVVDGGKRRTLNSPDIEWVEDNLRLLQHPSPDEPIPHRGDDSPCLASIPHEKGVVDSLRAVEKVTQHPGNAGRPRQAHAAAGALPEVWVQNASLETAWSRLVFDGLNIAGVSVVPFSPTRQTVSTSTISMTGTTREPWRKASSPCRRSSEAPFVGTKVSEGNVRWVRRPLDSDNSICYGQHIREMPVRKRSA
jgi:hypothetical protein